jgi:UPF0176 protein
VKNASLFVSVFLPLPTIMALHNRINRKELRERVAQDGVKRVVLSFYKYVAIADPGACRDELYAQWQSLGVLGRTYLAQEGINAQVAVPEENFVVFRERLYALPFLSGVRLNVAIDGHAPSFYKLTIKVRPKIVADGIEDPTFDPSNSGEHLSAERFNELLDRPGTVVVDMRNFYESEVGHFPNAVLPQAETFRDELRMVGEILAGKESVPVVAYCTGGIRCEKASAWLKHQGFCQVYQLDGGIIEYTRQCREKGLPNRFKGVNFVFDDRLSERVSDDVLAQCHVCGSPCDVHVNCARPACNLLFIQCPVCAAALQGCCSDVCHRIHRGDMEPVPETIVSQNRKPRYHRAVNLE